MKTAIRLCAALAAATQLFATAGAEKITDPALLKELNKPGPWDKYQQNPFTQFGPWIMVLRWGDKQPILIRYKNKRACDDAVLNVKIAGDAYVDSNGKAIPIPPIIAGQNRPYGFCIPS